MKKTSFLLLLCIFSVSVFSQVRRESNQTTTDSVLVAEVKKDKRSKKDMMKELDLTRDQKQKLKAAKAENKSAKDAIETDQSLSADQKKVKLRELRKTQLEKMKTILSKEQFEKLRKMRQENAGDEFE